MWEAVATGAAGVAGGALGYFGQKEANQTNMKIAQDNRDFQRFMSDTAYVRSTRDMRRAGLNPMLAFSQGGASTPAGSATTVDNANLGDAMQSGVSNAMEMARLKKELEAADAEIKVKNTQAAINREQRNVVKNTATLQDFEMKPAAMEAETRFWKAIQDKDWQTVDKWMDTIGKGVSIGTSAASLFNPGAQALSTIFGPRSADTSKLTRNSKTRNIETHDGKVVVKHKGKK